MSSAEGQRANRDPWLWGALVVGLVLRALPWVIWPQTGCLGDECIYLSLADAMAKGQGMVQSTTLPFVWAPGYVAFLALHQILLGQAFYALGTQIIGFGGTQLLAYLLARDHLDLRAGRIAAWLYGVSPTLAFFAGHMWTESLYLTLLLAILFALGKARERGVAWAVVPGVLIALCVLTRGVATYLIPIFLIAYVARRQWKHATVTALAAMLCIAPYSLYASKKFGGPMLVDTTLGQNVWLSNNDFRLVTFDYGVGQGQAEYRRLLESGRPMCPTEMEPVPWGACQKATGMAWIRDNPDLFVARIPERLAYLFNPNSFVTRHARAVYRPPKPIADAWCIAVILFSLATVWGGTAGAFSRGRTWLFPVSLGIVLYHCAVVAVLFGSTRFRVPLDGLWLIWLAGFLAAPKTTLRGWRLAAVVAILALAIPLTLWYLPVGLK